jgi:Tat protein translocase TatB subunit
VFALILDSLGSTELIFILAVALIFFGPRKLPQLARSVGKSVAEFRKASEDFKRTWEREVALESARLETPENTILDNTANATENNSETAEAPQPWIEPVTPDNVVARETQTTPSETVTELEKTETSPSKEPLQKHDWL